MKYTLRYFLLDMFLLAVLGWYWAAFMALRAFFTKRWF